MARRKGGSPVFKIIGGVVVLLIVAVLAAPLLIPTNAIRDRVITAVKDSTGRDLAINGAVVASLVPSLGVAAQDVTLSNAPWAGAQPMLRLGRLDVKLKLLPLLGGRIEVDSFVLDSPDITLQTNKQGHGNWEFTPPHPAANQPVEVAAKPAGITLPGDIALGDMRIVKGKLAYTDGVSGKTQSVDDLNLKVSLANLESPLAVDGSARWHDRDVAVTLTAAKPRDLLIGPGSPVNLHVSSDVVTLTYAGSAALANNGTGDGDIDVATPSVRSLVGWATGAPLTMPGNGLGPLSIKSHAAVAGHRVNLTNVQFGLDAIKANGDMEVDSDGLRPTLKGRVAIDALDLTPYLPPEQPAAPAKPGDSPAAGAPASGTSSGWSTAPIDVSGMRAADVDLAMSAGSITLRKIKTGKGVLGLVLTNGRLIATLDELALYQGQAKGKIVVDGSGPELGLETNLTVSGLQAEPLLVAANGFDRLSGTTTTESSLTSHGHNERELIGGLNGTGTLAFANGAIKGVDLVAMTHNVSSAFSAAGGAAKTDFGEMKGSYVITDGILHNDDLSLQSPTLQLTGKGTVDLPQKTLTYRVEPKFAGANESQFGVKELAGVTVPVLIQGPWNNLTYRPDLEGVLKQQLSDPGKLLGTVTGKKSGVKIPPDVQKLLPNLLGH
ncbi:MAG TPA: AsmA family protein [Patescibacteria group bacterium]|nr:AsmA family protein [Patescibacteria group bacterium]